MLILIHNNRIALFWLGPWFDSARVLWTFFWSPCVKLDFALFDCFLFWESKLVREALSGGGSLCLWKQLCAVASFSLGGWSITVVVGQGTETVGISKECLLLFLRISTCCICRFFPCNELMNRIISSWRWRTVAYSITSSNEMEHFFLNWLLVISMRFFTSYCFHGRYFFWKNSAVNSSHLLNLI